MDSAFDTAIAFVLSVEGGYVDNPLDPGGATNMGITLRTLALWRGTAVTKAAVKALTVGEATAIYGAHYWNAAHCAYLPLGLDLLVFDGAVNLGPGRSSKMLQAVAGAEQDGSIGPLTLAALAPKDHLMCIESIVSLRNDFYRSLSTFHTFGKGWLARTAAARVKALQLAGGSIAT